MKRTLLTLLTGVAMLVASTAGAEPSGDPFEGKLRPIPSDQTMSAEEVMHYALPYLPRVARCYKRWAVPDRKSTGELELYVVIARNGKVVHFDVEAPGVTKLRAGYLETCLRREVATWSFPTRKGFTNAYIPYFFLHTRAPATGPIPSCWNPKGCKERDIPRPPPAPRRT